GKDTQHELDQPLKKSAYVSNHRGPLLNLGQLIPLAQAITCRSVQIYTYEAKATFSLAARFSDISLTVISCSFTLLMMSSSLVRTK
ncbi:hypothetical protein EXA15_16675, partial [Vibrio cincinnatiensis]|nr:hypothetical protein [Vibrio cincinnatiensis]